MTLYEVLGVSDEASLTEIKTAHREAVKTHHPDAGGDPERFIRAQRAYHVLSDPERRARYDRSGVEDDGGPTDDRNAYAALATLLLQIADATGDLRRLDVVAVIRGKLQSQETAHRDGRRGLDVRIARVRLLRERLHGGDAEDDTLMAALVEREVSLESSRTREADQLQTIARALELLGRYSYEQDPSSPEEAAIWSALRSETSKR